ncbi:hypothetical protein SBRCBS47491_008255 [Sporothrix bragantina]|uniref:Major facilitator superfamily (MFS) profile domain-containing protein n=1 Tax=Sporothrix bragantina TaxID=671064 RepID=A0ABP0CLX6_9PEZI
MATKVDPKTEAAATVTTMHVEQGTNNGHGTTNLDMFEMASKAEMTEPDDNGTVAEEATGENLPDGYYYSLDFLGTFTALCLSAMALYMYLLMPSAVLSTINAALGPSPLISWWAIGRTAAQSVTFTLVGRLSDIFGRRYFFLGGNALALIGIAITASSFSIAQLAIGSAITGIGEAVQNSYTIALAELVPNKHRPMIVSLVFVSSAPFAGLGAITATTMVVTHGMSWRWCFYIPLITVGLALILLFICYHPPTYAQLHAASSHGAEHIPPSRSIGSQLRSLDYVGMALYIAGLVLILLPLGWGGTLFAWKSAATIATLVIGAVVLVGFVCWEAYVTRSSSRTTPLISLKLLTNRGFMALCVVATVGSSCYYPAVLLWPQQIAYIYGITGRHAGWLACTVGSATAIGSGLTGVVIRFAGNSRWVVVVFSMGMAGFVAGLAALTPNNLNLGIALTFLGPFCVGVVEVSALSLAPLFCRPEDLGLASGLLGTIRTGGASIATAIFTSVLSTRKAETIAAAVTSAAEADGFDMANIKTLIAAAIAGTLAKVPGITPELTASIKDALPGAYAAAFKTVYLVSLAFGGLAVAASLLTKNAAPLLTKTVSRKLQTRRR